MQVTDPVFVIGAPRSGTSFLSNLMSGHKKVRVHSELRVLELAGIAGFAAMKGGRLPGPGDSTRVGGDVLAMGKAYINLLWRHEMETFGTRRVGDKYPPYSMQVRELAVLFPNSKFVHIIRDGRAVVASTLMAHVKLRAWRNSPTPPSAFQVANSWNSWVRKGLQAGRALGGSRYIEIRYEDFLGDPQEVGRRLMSFIGEAPDAGFSKAWGRRIKSRSWKETLSPAELTEFERCEPASQLLEALGYPATPRELLGECDPVLACEAGIQAQQGGNFDEAMRLLSRTARGDEASMDACMAMLAMPDRAESVFAAMKCRDSADSKTAVALAQWMKERGLDEAAAYGILGLHRARV